MFDNLLNLVKEHSGDLIVKNQDVPNEHNEAAQKETANVIQNQLSQALNGGGLDSLKSFFEKGGDQNQLASNPLAGNMIGELTKNLQKFGVNPAQAGSIASQLLPKILGQFVSKTNDPKDSSFDLGSIVKSLGGGNLGGLGGLF